MNPPDAPAPLRSPSRRLPPLREHSTPPGPARTASCGTDDVQKSPSAAQVLKGRLPKDSALKDQHDREATVDEDNERHTSSEAEAVAPPLPSGNGSPQDTVPNSLYKYNEKTGLLSLPGEDESNHTKSAKVFVENSKTGLFRRIRDPQQDCHSATPHTSTLDAGATLWMTRHPWSLQKQMTAFQPVKVNPDCKQLLILEWRRFERSGFSARGCWRGWRCFSWSFSTSMALPALTLSGESSYRSTLQSRS
eukprot:evm.model.scf_728EXC.10 EVM.evm.TU.scf_728EXC.10   scf_728EXC:56549-60302(+)